MIDRYLDDIQLKRFIIEIGLHGYRGKKNHNLPSISWRTRKVGGVISMSLKA